MSNEQNDEHKGKKHKPGPNHPWRRSVPNQVKQWAREQSGETHINNYKKGGGLEPWNK